MLRGYLWSGPPARTSRPCLMGPGQDGPGTTRRRPSPLALLHNYAPSQIQQPARRRPCYRSRPSRRAGRKVVWPTLLLPAQHYHPRTRGPSSCLPVALPLRARRFCKGGSLVREGRHSRRVLLAVGLAVGASCPVLRPRRNATGVVVHHHLSPHAIDAGRPPDGGSFTTNSSSPSPESRAAGAPGPSTPPSRPRLSRVLVERLSSPTTAATFPVARGRGRSTGPPVAKARTRSTAPSTSLTRGTTRSLVCRATWTRRRSAA